MRICLISVEIFAWGKYGGYGRAARTIGRELVNRGVDVCAVVPLRKGQKTVENLDGITVFGFPPHLPWKARKLLASCDADIYHSCNPSLVTYIALKAMPHKKHLVTFRDPKDFNDWKLEFTSPSLNRPRVIANYFFENNILIRNSIKKDMDGLYTCAKSLIPKAKKVYRLDSDPLFLPTPVRIPDKIKKAERPTVCYLARLDRRKRPTLFLDLAIKFPCVNFIAVGQSNDKKWEKYLMEKYSGIPNLKFYGFIDQFHSDKHLRLREESWVMVNTATREGLPNSFLESAAAKCAILSHVDPDGFASRFGYHVKNDGFEKGLKALLNNDLWRERGESGYQYVKKEFEINSAIEAHLNIYNNLLKKSESPPPGDFPYHRQSVS